MSFANLTTRIFKRKEIRGEITSCDDETLNYFIKPDFCFEGCGVECHVHVIVYLLIFQFSLNSFDY